MNKTLGLAVGLSVLAIVVSFVGVTKTPEVVYNTVEKFGSASSPSVVDGCMDINGVETCRYEAKMKTATTTLCAFRAPASATSTLERAVVQFNHASSSAVVVYIAKAVSPFATTTNIVTEPLGAAAKGTLVLNATTTLDMDAATVFAPGTYLNVGIQGGDIGGMTGLAPDGLCQAVWQPVR